MSAALNTPVEYPADYNVFNNYYIGRRPGGGYQIGRISFAPPSGNPGNEVVNGRFLTYLARTAPANDIIFLAGSFFGDNPNAVRTDNADSDTVYNRSETHPYGFFYPTGRNGALLRGAYGASGSWPVGVVSTRGTGNDVYLFDGSRDLPFEIIVYFRKDIYGLDNVRRLSTSPAEILASEQTGFSERTVAYRFESSIPRLLFEVEVFDINLPFWTWKVSPYTGNLANGRYRINNGVITTTPPNNLPNCEIRSQIRFVYSSSDGFLPNVLSGSQTFRAACVESDRSLLSLPLGTSPDPNDINPIWSLYGGDVRINWLRQVSVNGGPWYTPSAPFPVPTSPPSPIIQTQGDRWVRALATGIGIQKGMPTQLVSP
jgi:hypothetical protein